MCVRHVQVSVCLGVLGFIAAVITCALPSWTINQEVIQESTNYLNVEVHTGLWMVCYYKNIYKYRCFSYTYKNPYTEVTCGLIVTCCVVSALSLLLAACTKNECSTCSHRWAAVGLLLSSLLLIIPVSLTASDTMRYRWEWRELGVCMYTGWVGGALMLLAVFTLCCCCCCCSRDRALGPE